MGATTLVSLVLLAAAAGPWVAECGAMSVRAGRAADENAGGCVIHYYSDLASKEPLVLHRAAAGAAAGAVVRAPEHWELPEGDEDHLYLAKGEEVLIACPGRHNRLVNLTAQPASVVGRCTGRYSTNVEITGQVYPMKDLACSRTSHGEIVSKNIPCGARNASLYEMGFHIREEWYPLIAVCHVHSRSNTLYTSHILQGETEEKRRRHIPRPQFDVGGDFYPGFSPNTAYRNSNATLHELLGKSSLFDSPLSKAMTRGHLAPDGDFPLTPYRILTYFYVNTAPQWRGVNGGNWLLLENTLRKYAKKKSLDLSISTGVYQVLKLLDESGKLKQFFLHSTHTRKQMPVPKFFWKIVYNPRTKQGVAFVILNNPFVEKITDADKLCRNICEEAGWLRRDDRWSVISKGYMYCCEVEDLRREIEYLPNYDIRSALRGPY